MPSQRLIHSFLLGLTFTLAGPLAFAGEPASDADVEAELDALIGPEDQADEAAAVAPPAQSPGYLRQAAAPKSEVLATKPDDSLGIRAGVAVLLLAGLGAAAVFLRRKQKSPLRPTQVHLSLVASVGVGSKAQVCVISVGREALLLGVTEHGVTPLRVYPQAELGLLTAQLDAAPEAGPTVEKPVALSHAAPEQSFQALLEKASIPKQAEPRKVSRHEPPQIDAADELPAHLKAALETAPKRARGTFDPPEGQASELARRFRNLQA